VHEQSTQISHNDKDQQARMVGCTPGAKFAVYNRLTTTTDDRKGDVCLLI